MLRLQRFLVRTSLALVIAFLNASAYAIINDGTVSTFSSSAGLDLENILYTVNLGEATPDLTVNGVTFFGTANLQPGVTLDAVEVLDMDGNPVNARTLTAPTAPDLDGGGTEEDALEAILQTLTFGTDPIISPFFATPHFTFDTDEGQFYRLQLLTYDTGFSSEVRNFDILVDGIEVVTDEPIATTEDNTIGRLYTLDFFADADETQVTFNVGIDEPGVQDPNPIINAVTLAIIPEPASITLFCLMGIGIGGLGRRRSR